MAENKETKWRYRLQLLSERHNRVVFAFSMPVWLTAVLGVLLVMATALFALFIVTSTPLRNYLPGYLDVNKRIVVVESAMRIDSIAHESNLRSMYLDNLMSILSDRKVSADSIARYDSVVVRLNDSIMSASEREQAFVAGYEAKERFGLNALDENSQLTAVNFINVVRGQVALPEEANEVDALFTTRLELSRQMPVLSPLESTAIVVRYIVGTGYEVTLQCQNDYIVVLSHLSSVMVDEGRSLKPGAVVGHAGAESNAEDRWITIRIWHKGKPIDPLSVMQY